MLQLQSCLGEFDEGVEVLVRIHGPAKACTQASPLPQHSRHQTVLEPLRSVTQPQLLWPINVEESPSDHPISKPETNDSHDPHVVAVDHPLQALQGNYEHPDACHDYGCGAHPNTLDYHPKPSPDREGSHINQKYTAEEGDYIIYAWHDKKMKWNRIKQEFAARFGTTPERTVQGLQAWYYRMNQRIPVWDENGWLRFDKDDDREPRHVSIKARQRDSQGKPLEPLGIAQRYPERAIHYSWVDPETKFKTQDWAAKRAMQYRARRERHQRKRQQAREKFVDSGPARAT